MSIPLLQQPADPVLDLIEELRAARGRPEAALRRAAPYAGAIAPTVIDLVERAADDVCLTPRQSNLLFWGVHVLAAGRRTELCGPLLRLLRCGRLEMLFGDATTETFRSVFVSIYDGNADVFTAAIADQRVDSFVRWGLFSALARLTFDGALAREHTLDLLDRFEHERLAPPLDPAWEGWLETVVYLRFEQSHDRLPRGWRDGLFDETISGQQYWERQIAVVGAMRPDDPGLLDRERLAGVTDLNRLLGWMPTEDHLTKEDARNREGDPAALILPSRERQWLRDFLSSKHISPTSMTLEQLDGYFSALAICPSDIDADRYLPALWNYDAETEAAPTYDNEEQAEYVANLLARYAEAVKRRIAAGFPHPLNDLVAGDSEKERYWAAGFIRGIALAAHLWRLRAEIDENCAVITSVVYMLAVGGSGGEELRLSRRERGQFFRMLPRLFLDLYRGWRGLLPMKPSAAALAQESEERLSDYAQAPVRVGRKIGRNEPCPCGSGKKFKRCCASVDLAATL
jgi:yecA family protein